MPTIKNSQVIEGKASRDVFIRKFVKFRLDQDGIRYDIAISEVIDVWGLGEGSIYQIVKKNKYHIVYIDKKLIKTMIRFFKDLLAEQGK